MYQDLKTLKKTVSTLLIINLSERIPLHLIKLYLKEVNKTYIVVTKLYEREKKFLVKETESLIKLTKYYGQQR